jgi:tetratricopeptide (TPR) repeat protein
MSKQQKQLVMKFSFSKIKLLVFVACFLAGCSKSFLDLPNPSGLPLVGTIKDQASLNTASNGVYIALKSSAYYNRTFSLIPELIGDNVFISRSNGGRFLAHDNFAVTITDGYVQGAWYAMYQVIANANLAIAGGESLPPTTAIDQLLGELYAVRALAHFDLVRLFAQPYNFTDDASHLGVPVITVQESSIMEPPRDTVRRVYEQIITDLNKALSLMNVNQKPGRMVPAAVNTLLAKVYLYMGDWEQAEYYASQAITGPFILLGTNNYVSSWNADFSSESLFELVNLATENAGVDGLGYLYDQSGYGEALATADLYNLYSTTDVRRSLIQVGVRNGTFENPAYFVRKYLGQTANIKVLRLSDAYLIRAEARAELGKTDAAKTTLAQQDLNTIVKRADASAADITLTGDDLIDRILIERRKEFAFEGHRLFDLTRRKKEVRHIRSGDDITTYTYPNNRFIMPIPFKEMNANDNMVQNPGWVQ